MNVYYLLAAATLLFFVLVHRAQSEESLPDWVSLHTPLVLVHSERGKPTIEYIANRFEAFWRVWGLLGVILTGVGMVFGAALVVVSVFGTVTQPEAASIASEPRNLLVIPGLNDFLPLAAAPAIVFALLVGMVVHEFGHAVLCRVGDIEIKSTGLAFLAFFPAGAFVEPDEESQMNASPWAQIRMISGGIMNNLAVTVVSLVLLIGFAGLLVPAPGGTVGGTFTDSPAENAGLEFGDRIVRVNEVAVDTNSELVAQMKNIDSPAIELTTARGETHVVDRSVFVSGKPANISEYEAGVNMVSVAGESVKTVSNVKSVLNNVDSDFVRFETSGGESHMLGVGARATIRPNTTASTRFSGGERVLITHISGKRVISTSQIRDIVGSKDDPGLIDATVVPLSNPEKEAIVPLFEIKESDTVISDVQLTRGIGGVEIADVGISFYPTQRYLNFLQGESTSSGFITGTLSTLLIILILPVGTFSGLPFNFAGFTPNVSGFVAVAGPLGEISWIVISLVSILFWMVWLNLNLALFNAIPTVALDGGKYIGIVIEDIVRRTGVENSRLTSIFITRVVVLTMLALLLMMIFLPAGAQFFN